MPREDDHARQVGADAVIGMRHYATEFAAGATEVLAYSTAVKFAGYAEMAQVVEQEQRTDSAGGPVSIQ